MNGASFFGRIGSGAFGDRVGPFNVCSTGVILAGLVAFCWTSAQNISGLIVWSLVYGFLSGVRLPVSLETRTNKSWQCIMNMQASCVAALATPETYGTVMGLGFGSVAIS